MVVDDNRSHKRSPEVGSQVPEMYYHVCRHAATIISAIIVIEITVLVACLFTGDVVANPVIDTFPRTQSDSIQVLRALKQDSLQNPQQVGLRDVSVAQPKETPVSLQEWVFTLALIGVSLVVAIVAWMGVTNVRYVTEIQRGIDHQRLQIEQELDRKKSEIALSVSTGKDAIDTKVENLEAKQQQALEHAAEAFSHEVNSNLTKVAGQLSEAKIILDGAKIDIAMLGRLSERVRQVELMTFVQLGFDPYVRAGCAQDLLQINGIEKNWRYFQSMYQEEISRQVDVLPSDKSSWDSFMSILKVLATPPGATRTEAYNTLLSGA